MNICIKHYSAVLCLLPLTGLHSATVSLAFAPKNRCVQTGKIIYEHSLQVKITTYRKILIITQFHCRVFCDDAERGSRPRP